MGWLKFHLIAAVGAIINVLTEASGIPFATTQEAKDICMGRAGLNFDLCANDTVVEKIVKKNCFDIMKASFPGADDKSIENVANICLFEGVEECSVDPELGVKTYCLIQMEKLGHERPLSYETTTFDSLEVEVAERLKKESSLNESSDIETREGNENQASKGSQTWSSVFLVFIFAGRIFV